MSGSTAALLGLGVAGAGAAYYFLVYRPRQQLAAAGGPIAPPPPHPTTTSSTTTAWSKSVISVENAIQSKTGIPVAAIGSAATSAPLAVKVAALPVAATALAQNTLLHPVDTGKAVVSAVVHPVDTVKSIGSSVVSLFGGGSSKVCRASNNKDVFPNDMQMCAQRYGITDCNACGQLYNLQTARWPWQ